VEWCRRGESNPRPRDYETLALPLSYAGTGQFSIVRMKQQRCQAHARRVLSQCRVVAGSQTGVFAFL
jgi:hypothetical protein